MADRMLPLLALLLAGCSPQETRGACGESFCLPGSAKLIDKKQPVHDFNIYRLDWRSTRFTIYEGNHPRKSAGESRIGLPLPMDGSAMLRRSGDRGSVLVNVANCQEDELECSWPRYLDVMGPCASPRQCQVKAFAAQLSRR